MINITLYEGDASKVHELIPNESVDLIITDPPYLDMTPSYALDDNEFYESDDYKRSLLMKKINWKYIISDWKRILKPDSNLIVFMPIRILLDQYQWFKINNLKLAFLITWKKPSGTNFGNYNRRPLNNIEEIPVFQKGNLKYNIEHRITTFLEYPNKPTMNYNERNEHPFQKPLGLIQDLIEAFSFKNDTVLDSFVGSGTTLDACIRAERNGIGIEINPKYIELTKKRIWNRFDVNYEFKKI